MLSWDGASQSHCSFSSLPLIKVGQRGACRRSVIEIITWLHSCWWKLWNWARLDLSNLKVKVQVCISVHSEGRTQQVRQKRTKKQVDEAASLLFFGGADVLPSLVAIKERESRDSHFYTPFSCTIINNSVIKSVHTHIIWYTLLSLVALDHSGISFLFAPIPQAKPPCNRSQHHRTSSPLFLHPAPPSVGNCWLTVGKVNSVGTEGSVVTAVSSGACWSFTSSPEQTPAATVNTCDTCDRRQGCSMIDNKISDNTAQTEEQKCQKWTNVV